MTKHDQAYGRQGGRIVDWVPHDPDPDCEVCGKPILSGMARHSTCEPEPTPSLFDA